MFSHKEHKEHKESGALHPSSDCLRSSLRSGDSQTPKAFVDFVPLCG